MGSLKIGKTNFRPGTKSIFSVPVTKDLCGDITIDTHVITGKYDGPTLLLLSMLHGTEWLSVLILRELVRLIDPGKLRGNVIAIPVANPPAMLSNTRNVLDNSDDPDANRAFGGKHQWINNQITNTIENKFFKITDNLIDYHMSGWGYSMADISHSENYPDERISEASKNMALAYGVPIVHVRDADLKSRRSVGYGALKYGIAGISGGIGGVGFDQEREKSWLERNVNGTMNVMRYLDMLDGETTYCEKYLIVKGYWRASPLKGGLFQPLIGFERQYSVIKKGEPLAKIICPQTFHTIEEIESPGEGVLFYISRQRMIRPGGWGYGIANTETGQSYWIDGK